MVRVAEAPDEDVVSLHTFLLPVRRIGKAKVRLNNHAFNTPTRSAIFASVRHTHPIDTEPKPLPAGIIEEAFKEYATIQRHRVEKMFNRSRAVFAEFIVAQLLPGSVVTTDPSAAWDVTWPVDGQRVRVEIKCSGEHLPRMGTSHRAKASWKFPIPKSAYDPETKTVIRTGQHNFDVLVLARHTGAKVDAGWTFYVLSRKEAVALNGRAKPADLAQADTIQPDGLADAVRRAALTSR